MRYLKTEIIKGRRIGFMRGRAGLTSAYLLMPNGTSEYLWGSGRKDILIKKIKGMI